MEQSIFIFLKIEILFMNNDSIQFYGKLCGLFYDATEKYASQQEVDFFASCIDLSPGRVLEPMSGSGRLQIPLLQRGYVVDGVDISSAMLARCRERCAYLGLKEPELYEQSLENFVIPHRYSTMIIAFGSLQLIADRAALLGSLQNLHAHMLEDGNLLIDIFIPDQTIDQYSVSIVRLDEHRVVRVTRRYVFDLEKRKVDTFCLYELLVNGMVQEQENGLIEIVWYSDDEWKELLLQAGFEIVAIHDKKFKESEPSRVIHARPILKN